MATDEQILAQTSELLANLQEKCWKGYEKKGMKKMFGKMYPNCVKKSKKKKRKKRKNEEVELYEEKVLREITEDEMRVLEDVLDDLDPTKLPLNDLFSNKMRVVIPFPTLDPESDLGKFAKFFRDQEYKVDWEKGMVYAEREYTGGVLDFIIGQARQAEKKKTKKIQMKIGKLFPKIAQIASKLDELFQIIKKEGEGKAWWNNATRPGQVARNIAVKVLSDEQQKSWGRLVDQMYEYIPAPGYFEPKWDETVEYLQKMSKYWQQNAGYIKDEINNIDNDKYSIIITRHPIDVLRMSDFDNITSCHSPASRTSAYQSYYKCAVAEAQGHGAVAYVVETEDLLSETNTGNIDSAEQEIQEGEIFYDDQRPMDTGDIKPISRTRIRHVRYYDTDTPKRYDDGQDVGMPEKRIYGAGIPGIVDRVTDWARSNQEEVIANMPKNDNGIIDLNKFMIFGGSYEDTAGAAGREKLMRQLLGPEALVSGNMKQNTDTEDDLDADLLGDVRQQYDDECELIQRAFNRRMAACSVDYRIDDDGDDGVFIRASAMIKLEWEADDWVKLPNTWDRTVFHSAQELNDIYGDIFYDDPYLASENGIIKWECNINIEHPSLGGNTYLALPEEFQEMCEKVDLQMDDRRDAFLEILSGYFRREGYMQGGEYLNLAINIEDGGLTSYEWDLETDGEYTESYESMASYSFDYDPEQLNITLPILMKLLDSREFRIQIRRNLLAMPQRNVDTEYFLQMNMSVIDVGGEARTTVTFTINRDEPDEMATLFQELVEGDMDDEDELRRVFVRTLAQIRQQAGQWPEQDSPATQGINEHLVKTWKRFLSN